MEKKKNNLHNLIIKDSELILDDFKVKGVTRFELIKSSADSSTELLIFLKINDLTVN